MAYYDIGEAFQIIEEEMIASMSRNLKRHLKTEKEEGLNYAMWQAEQLAALNNFRKDNKKKFSGYFSTINSQIEDVLKRANQSGQMEQEIAILEAIRDGFKIYDYAEAKSIRGQFFKINDRKLNALIEATKNDMQKAEVAMLRQANDEYRKIIFNSEVYYNSGVGTLSQCVDMATKDFLSKGITCVEYANGARVGIDVYSRMALRTAQTRAYLQGEAVKRDEWGINTVIVNRRGVACPKCLQWVAKVYYDDVWGNSTIPNPPKYPRLSEAIKGGLYHPNCKDIHTTYFEDVSSPPKPMSQKEIDEANRVYALEQQQRYNERQIRKYKRLWSGSTDPENALKYKEKMHAWQDRQKEFVAANSDVLKRRPELEKIWRLPDNLQFGNNSYIPEQDSPDTIKHEHTWIETITKQPTCTEVGEKTFKCSCGEKKKETIPALGHDWGDWVITRQPTTTEVGRKQAVCKRCGEKKYSTVPKLKAGTTPTIIMGIPEKAWGKTHADNMKTIMENAPSEAKRVWSKYEGKIAVYDPTFKGSGAHYKHSMGGIRVDIAADALGTAAKPKYETVFHEFGHNIDYLAGARGRTISERYRNKSGLTLGQMVKQDWQKFVNGYTDESEALTDLKLTLTRREKWDISDMIEGVSSTAGDYPLGSGHGQSYWQGRDNGKEAFAEMFSATVNNPDSLKAIKKVFPNAYDTFLKILEAI